jgi:hypothetical protein
MANRVILASAAMLLLAAASAHAQNYGPQGWATPDPNYYATVPGENGMTQAMYPCPRPTPPMVGQTLITYPPLAPQNMMYVHMTGNGVLSNGLCCPGLGCNRACYCNEPCGDQCNDQCGDPCGRGCGLLHGGLCRRPAGTTVSVMYGHHYHLVPHPSLTNQAPGLRTPAHVGCGM